MSHLIAINNNTSVVSKFSLCHPNISYVDVSLTRALSLRLTTRHRGRTCWRTVESLTCLALTILESSLTGTSKPKAGGLKHDGEGPVVGGRWREGQKSWEGREERRAAVQSGGWGETVLLMTHRNRSMSTDFCVGDNH